MNALASLPDFALLKIAHNDQNVKASEHYSLVLRKEKNQGTANSSISEQYWKDLRKCFLIGRHDLRTE